MCPWSQIGTEFSQIVTMQNKIQIWEWLVFWWAGRSRESDFLDFDAEAGVSQSTLVCDRNDETAAYEESQWPSTFRCTNAI